jgi:hypothetical protein
MDNFEQYLETWEKKSRELRKDSEIPFGNYSTDELAVRTSYDLNVLPCRQRKELSTV